MEQTRAPERDLAALIFDMEDDLTLVRDLATAVTIIGAAGLMVEGRAVSAVGGTLEKAAERVLEQWQRAIGLSRQMNPQHEKPLSPGQPF